MENKDYQSLDNILKSIKASDLSSAIEQMHSFINEHPTLKFNDSLNSIEEDFYLMLDYMKRGYIDPERNKVYEKLLLRMYVFTKNMRMAYRKQYERFFVDAANRSRLQSFSHDRIKNTLENFIGDIAMLSFEPQDTVKEKSVSIYRQHQEFVSRLFDYIVVSEQWKQNDADFYEALLLSPTIDVKDAMLLISAITLANITEFDYYKFTVLINTYKNSVSGNIRQRALVGWALSMPETEKVEITEDTSKEIVELQKQIVFCMNAEKDNELIERDIMPTLIKNSNFSITRDGFLHEKEEDPMEDILSPDKADKRMEEVEQSMRKISNMQKSGSDVFFKGFSQMKRFPFFYTLSNWFVPFYPEHPEVIKISEALESYNFMNSFMKDGPFCDSDKYSFTLSMSTIINKVPKEMQDLICNADSYAFGPMGSKINSDDETYIRRMYLQDLYRFYKLHPEHNSLKSPFAAKNYLLNVPISNDYAYDLARFFNKQHLEYAMEAILDKHKDESNPNYMFLRGIYEQTYKNNPVAAYYHYKTALEMEPENEKGKNGLARACMEQKYYEEAANLFDELRKANPEKKAYKLNYCIALEKQKRYDEAVTELYRLDYEMPDDIYVMRLLAWGLMGQEKLEQAEKIYNKILIHEKNNAADYLNAGYCQWFKGDIAMASTLFYRFTDSAKDTSLKAELDNDVETLKEHGITDTDIMLMVAISKRI